ncbi:hypothetical protein OKW28_008230 [Paraburkholderia sp. 40]
MDTSKPPQNAATLHPADDANAQVHALVAEDAPSLASDDALARMLADPPAAECPIMVLLVGDQAVIAEGCARRSPTSRASTFATARHGKTRCAAPRKRARR